ncbi:ATP-binding protein [Erysipelotrichaceae bacterium HCN-30851]
MKKYTLHLLTKQNFYSFLQCIIFLILATLLGLLFKAWGFRESTIVMVYILAVAFSSRFGDGIVIGLISAVGSILLFNYFFTAPYFTLHFYEANYVTTFLMMACVSLIISTVTNRLKQSVSIANKNVEEKQILLHLMEKMNKTRNMEDVVKYSIETFYHYAKINVGCMYINENEELNNTYLLKSEDGFVQCEADEDEYELVNSVIQHYDKPYLVTEQYYDFLIKGNHKVLGLLRFPKNAQIMQDKSLLSMIDSVINCMVLAMERIQYDQKYLKFKEEANTQRYRVNLLRSISHDLRTPLTGIMGNCEVLKKILQEQEAIALTEGIYEDANWLHSLVENILSLTKLQEGKMQMNMQGEAIDEIIGVAIQQFEKNSKRIINVSLPEDIVMVQADAKLLEQVILNLLDNASKHTPKEGNISIKVESSLQEVCIIVEDDGEGIASDDIENIFEMFYTTTKKPTDAVSGIGLGLTICKSIIEAHGGKIYAENRTDSHGARFRFVLPRKGDYDEK